MTRAIVYVTDAKTSTKVTTITVPADGQRAGDVRRGGRQGVARTPRPRPRSWPGSPDPDGQAILASFGFLPPS